MLQVTPFSLKVVMTVTKDNKPSLMHVNTVMQDKILSFNLFLHPATYPLLTVQWNYDILINMSVWINERMILWLM